MDTWDIVENYYYWDFHPRTTYLKNKIGLYKYLFKKTMASISEYYRDMFIDPLQEKCNKLIEENFNLKTQIEYYKHIIRKNKCRSTHEEESNNYYKKSRKLKQL